MTEAALPLDIIGGTEQGRVDFSSSSLPKRKAMMRLEGEKHPSKVPEEDSTSPVMQAQWMKPLCKQKLVDKIDDDFFSDTGLLNHH